MLERATYTDCRACSMVRSFRILEISCQSEHLSDITGARASQTSYPRTPVSPFRMRIEPALLLIDPTKQPQKGY